MLGYPPFNHYVSTACTLKLGVALCVCVVWVPRCRVALCVCSVCSPLRDNDIHVLRAVKIKVRVLTQEKHQKKEGKVKNYKVRLIQRLKAAPL